MPSKEQPDKNRGLIKQDRLAEQLVPNPSDQQPTILLTGWLGKGAKEGFWRLYLTPAFDEYVQFADKEVVHTQAVQAEQSPLGGTMVWLHAGTILQHTKVINRQVQADFLSGKITSEFMAGSATSFPTGAARLAALGARPMSLDYRCSINPHIPVCQAPGVTENCGTFGACNPGGPFGPSGAFVCGFSVGCTVGTECSVGC
jgi:hypothetical protein